MKTNIQTSWLGFRSCPAPSPIRESAISPTLTPNFGLTIVFGLAFCLTVSLLFPTQVNAQDKISIRDTRTGQTTKFEARVVSWDSKSLVYSSNSRENSIASSRVISVDYPKSEEHQIALQHMQQGKMLRAWQSFENARAEEPREWVKQEQLGQQLICSQAMMRQNDALKAFFELEGASPDNRFFHLIPVCWGQTRSTSATESALKDWLTASRETQALIAASWLLMMERESATKRLRELSQSVDSRIAHLATAQLWRLDTVDATDADIVRWKTAVERMPDELQAGPRYQIALTQKRRAETTSADTQTIHDALFALLQIPILFPEFYQLSGDALMQASQLLQKLDRDEEAAIVLAELKRDFAFSEAAQKMGARIEDMDQ